MNESLTPAAGPDRGAAERMWAACAGAHRRYWERTRAARGLVFDPTAEIVFERFRVVWPPELADAARPAGA